MNVLFVTAIADDGNIRAAINENGGLKVVLSGSANIWEFIAPELESRPSVTVERLLLSPHDARTAFQIKRPCIIFNEISESDSHAISLQRLHRIHNQINAPIINPPEAIFRTRRENLATVLDGIPHLRIPETVRVKATAPRQIAAFCATRFPGKRVLVRGIGDHGGISTIRLLPGENEDRLHRLAFDGRNYLLSEFIDYASADGLYRKYRIVLIAGKLYIRHLIISDSWMIHSGSRTFMRAHPEYQAEEAAVLENFPAHIPDHTVASLSRINEVMGVDYLGLDCSIDDDGVVTVFELNANMNILINNQTQGELWEAPIRDIKQAIKALIYSRATE